MHICLIYSSKVDFKKLGKITHFIDNVMVLKVCLYVNYFINRLIRHVSVKKILKTRQNICLKKNTNTILSQITLIFIDTMHNYIMITSDICFKN